jgi:hypothetical protein
MVDLLVTQNCDGLLLKREFEMLEDKKDISDEKLHLVELTHPISFDVVDETGANRGKRVWDVGKQFMAHVRSKTVEKEGDFIEVADVLVKNGDKNFCYMNGLPCSHFVFVDQD